MPGKFVLTKTESGAYRFNLVATNGQVIATSENYATKGAAQNGIDSVRDHATDAVVDDQTGRDSLL